MPILTCGKNEKELLVICRCIGHVMRIDYLVTQIVVIEIIVEIKNLGERPIGLHNDIVLLRTINRIM